MTATPETPSKVPTSDAPPQTPSTWLSSLFATPNSKDQVEDESGVALFVGNASLFQSPPPTVIRLSTETSNVELTPLLTQTSPVSSATSFSPPATETSNLPQETERRPLFTQADYDFWIARCKIYMEQANQYLLRGRDLLQKASQSTPCVVSFFWFNVLWTFLLVAHSVWHSSPTVQVVAPSSSYMAAALMEKSCPLDCDVNTDALFQARANIEAQVRRTWKPFELLQLTAQQISAGQAILERVKAEYEAILVEIERDLQLCRLPLAHVLNPLCPPPTFDTESFVLQAHYL